jgi:PKD repeat protein
MEFVVIFVAIFQNLIKMEKYLLKKQVLIMALSFLTLNLFAQTFIEQTSIVLPGINGSSVSWGDYDNDGYLDILLTGYNSSYVPISKIYRNNGNNTFSELTGITLPGITSGSVAWGDYDNDGFLDILLTGLTGTEYISKIYHNNGNNTFTEQANTSLVGLEFSSVAWGDYDNDGYLDILIVGKGVARIYHNNKNGTFAEQTNIHLIGFEFGSVAWGDYDNDGYLDILMSGNGVSKIYRNDTNNNFIEQTTISITGVGSSSVAWGDYDNDGNLDILLTGQSGSNPVSKIYRNNGNNTFTEQTGISLTGVYGGSVGWGDYDNDGNLDIILTGTGNSYKPVGKIYHNDGNNSFTELANLPVMNSSVAWGDYNNDGKLDVLLTGLDVNGTAISKIYLNTTGYANTKPSVPTNLKTSVRDGIVTFTWDKATDTQTRQDGLSYNLYVYESGQNTYKCSPHAFRQSHLLNGKRLISSVGKIQWNANGYNLKDLPPDKIYYWSLQAIDAGMLGSNFAEEQSFSVPLFKPIEQANSITITDVKDNQATATWANGGGTKRAVFIKQGTGYLADPVDNITYSINSTTPGGWRCVYNGTENTAIISGTVPVSYYTIQICEYNGASGYEKYSTVTNYQNPTSFSTLFTEQTGFSLTGVSYGSSAWGDYNNDGNLDILLTGTTNSQTNGAFTKIYRNNGNNTFTEQTGISLPYICFGSVAWGDCDNDGDLDILLTGLSNGFPISKIFRNNGNDTFTEQINTSLAGLEFSSVAFGDYDNDGGLDILVTGLSDPDPVTKIYHNNGKLKYIEQDGIIIDAVDASSVAWGDYDNNGELDLLVTGLSGSSPISKIYHNNGNGTFMEQTDISLTGVSNSSVAWGDYDNDGDLDILLTGADANSKGISKIYKNNGNNTFTEQAGILLTGVSNSSVAWGDFDNDGDMDILMTGISGSLLISKIYKNNGDNSFSELLDLSLPGVSSGSVKWGDSDNDGDLDILLTGRDAHNNAISKIYKNNTPLLNKNPDTPTNLSYEIKKAIALLKWDRVVTDETSPKSITYNLRIGRKSGSSDFLSSESASNGFRKIAAMGNAQTDTTFIFKNLRWDTTYYASVQAVDNSFRGGPFSNEVQFKISPLQPSQLHANHITSNSILLKWKRGNGDQCIIFASEGTSGLAAPQDYSTYYYNPKFKEGSPIGATNWYCVYKGEEDSVLISGLDPKKSYTIHAIEFQGINGSEVYAQSISSENIGVFSTSLFSEQSGIALPDNSEQVLWGDYDNDGYLDLLLKNSYIPKIWHNNGNNTFSELISVSSQTCFQGSLAWGDYDKDGYLDILMTGMINSIPISKIFRNNGDNSFTEQTGLLLTGVFNSSAVWGDYNNDGFLDILLSGMTGVNPNQYIIAKIYRNNGDNSFTEQTSISLTGVTYGSVSWCDYNNDGNLDLLLTGSAEINATGSITKIYHNNGDETFSEVAGIYLPNVQFSSVAWGDYDNDGNTDLLLTGIDASYNRITKIFRNNGDKTFIEQSAISLTGIMNGSVAWGDYDNDGNLDVLLTGSKAGAIPVSKIYHNNGNNSFTELTDISLTGVYGGSSTWGDYDNDGDLDIILSGGNAYGNAKPIIYRNNLIMNASSFFPNAKPNAPIGLTTSRFPGITRLSWAPVTNDETPSITMSYNLRYKLKNTSKWKFAPEAEANGFRNVPALGNLQLNKSFNLKELPSGIYYWQVQAVDQGLKGGAWSVVDSFEVKNVQTFYSYDIVCLGYPTHFTDQSVTTDGITSWRWDFKDGITSSLQNPIHTFSTSGTHIVKLAITNSVGSKDSLEQNIIVKPKPIADFSATTVCQGTETAMTNLTNTSGLNITSWSWDYGDGKGSISQNPGSHGYLTAGDYQLTLLASADNGCSGTVTKTVTVGAYPVAAITANTALTFCAGDSVTLSVGSNSNFSYIWMLNNTGITNANSNNYKAKVTGNYSVEVTNSKGSCKTTSSQVSVTKLATPAIPAIIPENYITGKCPGTTSIVLKVDQSVTEYSYQWKRNGTPISNAINSSYQASLLPAGDYSVTASLSGCKTESLVQPIIYDDAPAKPLVYAQGPSVWYLACSNDSAAQYKWYFNGTLIPGADSYFYVANRKLGKYNVSISNAKGCFTMSDTLTIPKGTTGIEDVDPFVGLKIYPNPTNGLFTIEMNNQVFGNLIIGILNQGGKEILNIKFKKTTEHFSSQVDLSGQPKGMYLINLKIDKYLANRKVVVK